MPASFPNGPIGLAPSAFIASRWYAPIHGVNPTGQALTISRIYLTAFFVGPSGITIQALGVRTGAVLSSNVKLGVYASVAGRPGLRVAALASAVSTPANNTDYSSTLASNVKLGQGMYWTAMVGDTTNTYSAIAGSDNITACIIGGSAIVSAQGSSALGTGEYYDGNYTTGLPSDLTSLTTLNTGPTPMCMFQAA